MLAKCCWQICVIQIKSGNMAFLLRESRTQKIKTDI